MAEKNYSQIASEILKHSGGAENINKALHCATRLRLNLNNNDLFDEESIKKIDGVLGVVKAGVQMQVIIGPDVDKVHAQFANLLDQEQKHAAASSEDKENVQNSEKKNWSIGKVFSSILDGISGCMGPVIPVITLCAFFKVITSLFGPDMLGWIPAESTLYTLLTFVGDAGFYFFPVIIGYTAAKKFNVLPVLGIFMGCIMMHPTFTALAAEGAAFDVYGIPCMTVNYASSILPIIMSVWVMHYVETFFNGILPTSIRTSFAPFLTVAVMLPITLCVLGPAGTFLGNYIIAALFSLQNVSGVLGMALIGALFPILVMSGMHMILLAALFQVFAQYGMDGFAGPALTFAAYSVMGVCIGAALRLKNKEERTQALEYGVTAILAGTSEPCLYGICTRYKKPFIGLLAGGFAGGIYGGLTGVVACTLVPTTSFLSALSFTGGTQANFINGLIACGISVVTAAAVTYFFGFSSQKAAVKKSSEGSVKTGKSVMVQG